MIIIGLDAAVQDKDIGCVLGNYSEGSLKLLGKWERKQPLTDFITDGIKESEKAILAIDAPLGWPVSFRKILNTHSAGLSLDTDPELFFKRQTDLDIRQRFKKWPLEISADRIARTAFFTLNRIGKIEKDLDYKLNLLWSIQDLEKYGMLEVYPAATLLSLGFSIKGYKKDNAPARDKLYDQLKKIYNFNNFESIDLTTIDHDFDALVCCLACVDFIEGKSLPPAKIDSDIKEEGWIWVKGRNDH
ncbi:DUF429 domain-containing protein [Salegentibacter sp. JZCK2]|uniref:DUF429 domain-containing protein n=1 Tax=Salegentibacter tibetensis TaxID=2873600 RepID=UPI001CCE5833|nr:DUF429 domain-containing protein [Salegentibacter tibetensis]MBZ9728388.1 DUF429 domain-containing protein [Salegentibacter tibetensis]